MKIAGYLILHYFIFQNEFCVASGPGKDMFESTKIIGKNQFNKALVGNKNDIWFYRFHFCI